MRNPDSLDVGEPGCKDNIELQHLNRSSLHFASLLSPAYWDRAWWRVEARRVGSDSPSVPAVVTAWWPRNDPDPTGAPTTVCLTCGAAPCLNTSFCGGVSHGRCSASQKPRSSRWCNAARWHVV